MFLLSCSRLLHIHCMIERHLACRLFDMNVIVQQAGQISQALLFHPWQSNTPDVNISNVNATAIISTGGVTDNMALAKSQYSLFQANSSDPGRTSLTGRTVMGLTMVYVHACSEKQCSLTACQQDQSCNIQIIASVILHSVHEIGLMTCRFCCE